MRPIFLALAVMAAVACRHPSPNSPTFSDEDRPIIEQVEAYRLAVERRDAPALVLMASKDYWEDGGTVVGADDYGYTGLKSVLSGRFQSSENIRYSIRYLKIKRSGNKAFVEGWVHASWTLRDARGEIARKDKSGQEQWVLRLEGESWKFLSGM